MAMTKKQWIEVDKKLPSNGEHVLLRFTVDGRNRVVEGYKVSDDSWFNCWSTELITAAPVTHWMTLPESLLEEVKQI